MTLFEWTTDYELEIEPIDNQHKELVRMINDLYDALKRGDSRDAVDKTLNKLLNYVDIHFQTEERAMQEMRYPGYEEHLRVHHHLKDRVYELKKEQLQGREIATFELLNFLADWLKNHIGNMDKAFGLYARGRDRRSLG